jgi:hypothetical protein
MGLNKRYINQENLKRLIQNEGEITQIIEYIKKGQAILFNYQKKAVTEFKQVAPLQIRYYDNRYYMLASMIDEKTDQPTNQLQTYCLDMFVEKKVNPAVDESDENT